jgi:hypothetical protein
MSLTAPDLQAKTDQSTTTVPHPGAKPVHSRRYRIDLIGVSALLVAGAGLAGSLILFRAQSTDSTTTATLGTPSVSVAPLRDQWYLERSGSQTAQTAAQLTSERDLQLAAAAEMSSASVPIQRVMNDRWYEDAATTAVTPLSGPALRDQWYFESPTLRSAPSVSTQPRDRWYLDGR